MELSGLEYKLIVESSPNMIWRSGLDGNCYYFNETWLRFTGRTMEQEMGDGWVSGVHPEDVDRCMETYLSAFRQREPFEMEYRLKRHDGLYRWINDRGVPVYHDGEFHGYIGSCMDVSEKIEGMRLTEMAHYDKLTGVYNRNYLEILIDYEYKRFERDKGSTVYLMMDIDNFKYFNDQYGHDFGDQVLSCVAGAIAQKLRHSDYIGRFGGDEFLAILPQSTVTDAMQVAQRILDEIATLNIENSYETIGLSIGIAAQQASVDPRMVLKSADEAMFRAKKSGGNQYST
jgi:diguanylate cyclase (GGDEF)-like protein/PAS domain S-box-containing protein